MHLAVDLEDARLQGSELHRGGLTNYRNASGFQSLNRNDAATARVFAFRLQVEVDTYWGLWPRVSPLMVKLSVCLPSEPGIAETASARIF